MTPGIFCDIGWFAGPIVSAKITNVKNYME